MTKEMNIFVAHCGEHEDLINDFKRKMESKGYTFKDSSLTSEDSNHAHDENYIKNDIIRPKMEWAGTVVVLVGKETAKSDWVNWEIEQAEKMGKKIIGVWVKDSMNYAIPEALRRLGDSLVPWNTDDIDNALKGNPIWKNADGSALSGNYSISHVEC